MVNLNMGYMIYIYMNWCHDWIVATNIVVKPTISRPPKSPEMGATKPSESEACSWPMLTSHAMPGPGGAVLGLVATLVPW